MKNNKPITIKPDVGPVRPGTNPYGDDDIPEIDLPKPKRDPGDVPMELQSVGDSDISAQE